MYEPEVFFPSVFMVKQITTGIILGLQKVCWTETPLICVETDGADCFDQSMKQGKLVKLSGIRTIAKSLGALAVTKKLLHLATEEHRVLTRVVSDQQALQACLE